MSWYRRTKLVFDSLRRSVNPKNLPRSHHVSYDPTGPSKFSWFSSIFSCELGLRSLNPKTNRIVYNPFGACSKLSSIFPTKLGLQSHVPYSMNNAGSSKFPCFSSISSRELGLRSLRPKTNRIAYNPFAYSSNRFYYVDRYQVRHFKQRGPIGWFQNPNRTMVRVVLVGSGALISLYFGNLETVPYTKRTHLVLLPKAMEKLLGETVFENLNEIFTIEKDKILPENHPKSIRVQIITKKVVDAMERGVRSDAQAHASSSHLEGLNWEVLVVEEPTVNAFCLPAGKIVVYTGLLDKLTSDVELATVISHEVGHVVARHGAEKLTKSFYFAIRQLVLYQLVMPDAVHSIVNKMSKLFLELPFSRKMEKEADYIGLLLLASAGYDPRVAPKVYEKLDGEISALEEFQSTHPSGKTRSQLLAQANVMEEALTIYRNVQSRQNEDELIFKFCVVSV